MSFGVIKLLRGTVLVGALAGFMVGCGGSGAGSSSGSESEIVGGGATLPGAPGSAGTGSGVVAAERSALLTWDAPFERVNKTSISMAEIDGYVIRYGQNFDELDGEIYVAGSGSGQEHYQVNDLDDGPWYFTVQVVDHEGLMSAPSAIVSKQI